MSSNPTWTYIIFGYFKIIMKSDTHVQDQGTVWDNLKELTFYLNWKSEV